MSKNKHTQDNKKPQNQNATSERANREEFAKEIIFTRN